MFNLENIWRENIRNVQPYSSARDEFRGKAHIWLDANESPMNTGWNRYPDPRQRDLKQVIAHWRNISPDHIFLGNGSDEAIDLLVRACCEPGRDAVVICPPTYGMYAVSARIQDAVVKEVPLTEHFEPALPGLLEVVEQPDVKITFLCSPNNPTGNSFAPERLEAVLQKARGLVVIDEAYIDFSSGLSCIGWLDQYPNLVVLQTMSKAWGLAALRLGMAFASPDIVAMLNRIKPPYNVPGPTQQLALKALEDPVAMYEAVKCLQSERVRIADAFKKIACVQRVYPSDANFLLLQVQGAREIYRYLAQKGIVVRDRGSAVPGTIRISVGTPEENNALLKAMYEWNDNRDAGPA